jgi:D-alanyl-D-alanine carboxypeptidase
MGGLMRVRKGSDLVYSTPALYRRKRLASAGAWLVLAALLIGAWAPQATARVQASILLDAQTGKTLEAHNPDGLCYPASLTKLMTLYMTFRELTSGKMTLGQELTVSRHAAAQKPTKLYLKPGERISVRSAILAITTRSANDAAVVLAEATGGSESEFAEMMNQRARALGLTSTTFRNASGLPNPYQKTTARDMSKLAMAILEDFPEYYHFFKESRFEFRGRTIYGHDHLLARYPGVDGMKTGYTVAAGFNIVTSAVRDDHRLLGVVMGGRSVRSRDWLMMALLNRGFASIRKSSVTASNEEASAVPAPVARYKKVSLDDTEQEEAERPDAGWFVQLGGTFHSPTYARRALKSALRTYPEGLSDANPLVVKLRNGRYLARFSELDASAALAACRLLRSRKFTCNAYQLRSSGLSMASVR